jgi:iron complex outermembrane recepter protein
MSSIQTGETPVRTLGNVGLRNVYNFDPGAFVIRGPSCSHAGAADGRHAMWIGTALSCAGMFVTGGAAAASDEGELRRGKVEEVIVTAQRHEERLQDVPIAITVVGGDDLDRNTAEGISEVLNRVPGVATTLSAAGRPQVAVRGVTAGGPTFNGSSPIAYYLDSVPFGFVKTAIVPDSNAYDLDRIEVLRGPQGTLYGASAQNGVVRVLTKEADLNEFELKARTSVSSTDGGSENYRGDMAMNAPIVEGKMAARAVVGYEDLSGWIDSPIREDLNDSEIVNARLKVRAQPTDAFSIGLSGWISRSEFGGPPRSRDGAQSSTLVDEASSTDYDVYGLRLGYDFGSFSIESMTSSLDYASSGQGDISPLFGGVPTRLLTALDSEVFSQEIVLRSANDGAWRWSVGGIYRDAEDRLVQAAAFLPATIDFNDTSESIAVYGELTRKFLDGRFELTGGARYFEDDVVQSENIRHCGALCPGEPLFRVSRTFDKVSPRVVMTFHPGSDTTLYASYAEGFRSGFSQNSPVVRSAPQFPPLEADNLTNYEFGVKGTLANGTFSYDAAAFYIDWEDVQQTLVVIANGAPVTAVVNGESASGAGFEFGFAARPGDRFSLGASFSWNDLQMDEAVLSRGVVLFDAGDRLNLSPEYTIGLSADYAVPFGSSGFEALFAVSGNHISSQGARTILAGRQLIAKGDDMTVGRASISINSPGAWSAMLFVDNISNEDGSPVRQAVPFPDWDARIRPRTIGAQLEFRF